MFVNFKVLLVGEPPGRAVCVLFAPVVIVSVLCDGYAGTVSVLYLLFVI